ncbi:MAG TPA: peptide-methionine (S)-S-oxide reductase, partial [Epsilonproteobacteria bacterium]|nr:peptide-methionine (S)-S-oxide reductase [Campylobacterota bacterium]
RSVILYETEEIKEKALKAREKAQEKYSAPIVTIIEPLDRFYMAESYPQDYYRHNANQGYCMAVISPKVAKLKEKFSKKVKQ